MRLFAILFLLIFVAILFAANAETEKKKTTFRLPLKRAFVNKTALYPRTLHSNMPVKYDSQAVFTIHVGIGDPLQWFELVVDSGYPHIVVADLFCKNCGDPAKIPEYNGGASKSFKDLQTSYLGYNKLLRGTWTSDNFQFTGFQSNRPFVRLSKVLNYWVSAGKYSGLLGLGLHNSGPYHTFIEILAQSNILDDTVISCHFTKDINNPGQLLFGSIDNQYIDGELTRFPVLNGPNDALWTISISDLQVNSRSIGSGNAYLDTGVQYVYLPFAMVEQLYSGTGAQNMNGIWAVPDPFPYDVSFIIDDRMFTIPKEDVPMREMPKYGDLYRGIYQIATNDKLGLGLAFITKHYVVFDFKAGAENVGIGKRK